MANTTGVSVLGFIGKKACVYLKNGKYVTGTFLLLRNEWVAIETEDGDKIFQHDQVDSVVVGVDDGDD